ncbi:DNA polymerase Y family protein [Jatrophihabitans telluris]|uniref:DNA polymerase Y family protein n=1 Tax=Jatrophihabitans telluris TaxID=2038343 RepID=A0ABY4R1A3_9ACTN|nr:DNA polymerase Y family protein [Jatrophihabitans telluris]UQX89564.1 DNA polymerase Y family protein [Jatrophihabitans telluris]
MTAPLRVRQTPPRMAAIWCPDWPVTAARAEHGLFGDPPVAVFTANRVVACSQSARNHGIKRGLRRREAQSRCPDLIVLARNEAAEARAFEPVISAIEAIAPGVEVDRPGLAAIGIGGPTRYFGGETAVLHALSRAIGTHTDNVLIGVADGAFAAEQAARHGTLVPAGTSPAFLAQLPIDTLDEPELVDLLTRLGIRTLGAFAALPAADVHARFGPAGAWAHRQAGGVDARPIAARRPPVEFEVTVEFDPPLDRVDSIAFSARGAVEQFILDLADHGLACTCFELISATDRGEESVRRWRHAGILSAIDVTDRIRWQLEGWLNRAAGEPNAPTGPITSLQLVPVDTVPTGSHQRALWGADGAADERAHRALARVATLLGHGSVATPVVSGGRSPAQRTKLIPWGDDRPDGSHDELARRPWPGRLPSPAPSVILDPPQPVEVRDGTGHDVLVTERGALPNPPVHLVLETGRTSTVTAWAGPWPVDERWWDCQARQQLARLQLVDGSGRAYLVCYRLTDRRWYLEGIYD